LPEEEEVSEDLFDDLCDIFTYEVSPKPAIAIALK
jgi:hypothetical protein